MSSASLIPRNTSINLGNPIDIRVKKTEENRLSIINLQKLFQQYVAQVKLLSSLKENISRQLEVFYKGDNPYHGLVTDFTKYLKLQHEYTVKEIHAFEEGLTKIRGYEKKFENMIPFSKQYFKNNKLLTHYEEKIPKLIEANEAARKKEGRVSDSKANRLMRNQKKLEDARINTLVGTNNIVAISNNLNLERFEAINPLVSLFIKKLVSLKEFDGTRLLNMESFEQVLNKKVDPEFNNLTFINLNDDLIKRISQSSMVSDLITNENRLTQTNIQNNHYYYGQEPKIDKAAEDIRPRQLTNNTSVQEFV